MTTHRPDNPLIVQGDHTYRITPLSVWNACAAGVESDEIVETLREFSKYDVPRHVAVEIRDYASRYGRLRLLESKGTNASIRRRSQVSIGS